MIPRRLKWLAVMVFSGISIVFSILFYKLWWHISIISRLIRTNSYLRNNIDATGLEQAGLFCFVLATFIIIITVIVDLCMWWKDEN